MYVMILSKEPTQAIEHPENYVLKPQREGGGHLIWGEDIKKILTNEVEPEEGKDGLILMNWRGVSDTSRQFWPTTVGTAPVKPGSREGSPGENEVM